MAVRGSLLKQEIIHKILETFPNSFLYNDGKEIRINGTEAGAPIQIKVTLTAAKEPVENDNIVVTSTARTPTKVTFEGAEVKLIQPNETVPIKEPTEEEKARLKTLLEGLGF